MPGSAGRREQIVAGLLWYGTWIASAIIATGMIVGWLQKFAGSFLFDLSGYDVVKAGVALFILLPVARVALMLMIFLRERDYVYVMISALVLLIIAAGIFIEL
jgi:uncharacterized membrane protein